MTNESAAILTEIEALISARLFGTGPWLADKETAGLLHQRILQMGLEEPVPGEAGGSRNTALGNELDVVLLLAFLGVWDQWGIPEILEERGFIDRPKVKQLIDLMDDGDDPEEVLKPHVIDAYRRHHGNV
jgi:hypothetical protein